MKYEILAQREYKHYDFEMDHYLPLTELRGATGDEWSFGLNVYQYEYDIAVTRDGETKEYTVIYQLDDRIDSMRAYGGYELIPATCVGCDSDQSSDVIEFCGGNESIIEELQAKSEEHAKAYLEDMLEEYKPVQYFHVCDTEYDRTKRTYTVQFEHKGEQYTLTCKTGFVETFDADDEINKKAVEEFGEDICRFYILHIYYHYR